MCHRGVLSSHAHIWSACSLNAIHSAILSLLASCLSSSESNTREVGWFITTTFLTTDADCIVFSLICSVISILRCVYIVHSLAVLCGNVCKVVMYYHIVNFFYCVVSLFTSSFTRQVIFHVITTLSVHYSLTLSLQAQNLPFHKCTIQYSTI